MKREEAAKIYEQARAGIQTIKDQVPRIFEADSDLTVKLPAVKLYNFFMTIINVMELSEDAE